MLSNALYQMDDDVMFHLGEEEPEQFFTDENKDRIRALGVGESVVLQEGAADFEVTRIE
jgi:hypothetical protein